MFIATTGREISQLAIRSLMHIKNKSTMQRPMTSTNKKFQASMKLMTEEAVKAHEKFAGEKDLKNQHLGAHNSSDVFNRNSDELLQNNDYVKTPEVLK